MIYNPTLEQTLSLAARFRALTERTSIEASGAEIERQATKLTQRPVRLAVVGEVKKGKSSFINALLGHRDISPTATEVATSTVYRIGYGPQERAVIHFAPDESGDVRDPVDIDVSRVAEYGVEDANPNNEMRVDYIQIEMPSPMLDAGFEFIDTPGLGALFSKHAAATWKHLPTADAAMFVLDSKESVMTADEVDSLKRLVKLGLPVHFVQTKTDIADRETVESWAKRNCEIIGQALGITSQQVLSRYFPVSSRLKRIAEERGSEKHLARSGFPQLTHHLQSALRPAFVAREGREVLAAATTLLRPLQKLLRKQHQVNEKKCRNELQTVVEELKEKMMRLEEWKQHAYKGFKRDHREQVDQVYRRFTRTLEDTLEPSSMGPVLTELEHQIEEASLNLTNFDVLSDAVVGSCQGLCAEHGMHALNTMDESLRQQLMRSAKHLDEAIPALESTDTPTTSDLFTEEADYRGRDLAHHDQAQALVKKGIGGMIAGGMAFNIGTSVALATVPGVNLLWGIGFLSIKAGMFYFDKLAEEETARRSSDARQKLTAHLTQVLKEATRRVKRQGVERKLAFDKAAIGLFDAALESRNSQFKAVRDEIQRAQQQGRTESEARTDALQERLNVIGATLQDFAKAAERQTARR